MGSKVAQKVKLPSFDELLGTGEPESKESIVMVPIRLFHSFKGHPFQVSDDEKMEEIVESIRKYGVLVPGIVRPQGENGYEVVAGHRRWRACELQGWKKNDGMRQHEGFPGEVRRGIPCAEHQGLRPGEPRKAALELQPFQ